jgi:hypothetical protein
MGEETRSGFHFWNLYQNCRWKFFLRYIMGIEPDKTAKALIFGGAFHAGKAAFYKGEDHREAFLRELGSGKEEYENPEDYIADENRGTLLLDTWVEQHGRGDLIDHTILAIEEPMEVALPNGYVVTFRCDAVLRPRGRTESYVYETKTTGFSVEVTEVGVAMGDQATMYLWGTRKAHPEWNVAGLIPDIAYQRQSRITCARGDVVFRTNREMDQFEKMAVGLLSEISAKTQALDHGHDPLVLFDRNTSWCTSYNRPCEYASICRNWDLKGIPEGFRKTSWSEKNAVVSLDPSIVRRYANEAVPDPVPDGQLELPGLGAG